MSGIKGAPAEVRKLLETCAICEFATVSASGVPIDTPVYYFPSDDLATLDIATGLAYPAKAERARRNPKVGVLVEGGADEPVVLIRGRAAVRDADLQKNAVRYISETGFDGIAFGLSWSDARKAVWYWTRMIVETTPERILWWDNPAAMDGEPHVWNAAVGTQFPQSDPAPSGRVSPSPKWEQRDWRDLARDAFERGAPAHLTICDADSYPLSARARQCELVSDRFRLLTPKGVPWIGEGQATLTFLGMETFVGEAARDGDITWLTVERALPQMPMLLNPAKVLRPDDELRAKLMSRLEHETNRRGQPIPVIPEELPQPTRLARLRRQRAGEQQPMLTS